MSLVLFRRYPIRVAILMNFLGGWALLPIARFSGEPSPFWILGNGLHTEYFLTKATVTGLSGLLGVLLFDRQIFRSFRLTFWDLPMLMWCIVPLLSGIANPDFFGEALVGEIYQLLAWGVSWVLGRLYFSDTASLRLAAKAFVIAGLLYVPICLFEVFAGPQIYAHLYGYQPYRWVRTQRSPRIPPHRPARNRHATRHLDGDLGADRRVAMASPQRRPHSRHSHRVDGRHTVRRDPALPIRRLHRFRRSRCCPLSSSAAGIFPA